ncbi:MAG: MarR family transcriptional regulator [Actinobacteria bacterium]|nr:MarR family transcriptional regulator [Actinomycetota bacterium]
MSRRLENLLGALAVGLSDAIASAVETTTGHAGAMGAALATLAQEPGLGIEQLRVPLGRTQSATVRVVDQLVAEGYAERRPGHDQRCVAVFLTAKGGEAAARVLASREQALSDAVRPLTAGERKALTAALEKVLARITSDRAHAELICRLCDVAACPESACPVELAARTAQAPAAEEVMKP